MTIFAGAFSINKDISIPKEIKDSLKNNLRSVDDGRGNFSVFDQKKIFLTKWDSNAFNEPAWSISNDGNLSCLVGDPLFSLTGTRMHRGLQLAQLAPPDGGLNSAALAQTRGAFSIVQYDTASHTLRLSTDMIGLRSLYYTVQKGIFFFASALRTLEAMPGIGKRLSTIGMLELSMFAFPLAERTPYEEISLLRECELLTVTAAGIQSTTYYDWTSTDPASSQLEQSAELLFSTFQEAIRIRIGSDSKVYAFLSGGMDSRAIVSALLSEGSHVEALNFSPNESQDRVYAKSFIEAAGPNCNLHCLGRKENPNFSLLALDAKTTLERNVRTMVDRPALMWSGDGGSVGLGHVYMDETMLDLAEKGDTKAAFTHFLSFNRLALPEKFLSKKIKKHIIPTINENAFSELNRYPRADIGRRLYFFLLFNDQRRHLFKHFESIDRHGLEFLLPFYDVQFLKMVANTPSRWGILHRLYSKWFDFFPAYTRSTPWQTYPGHVPCPVAGDTTLSYQWASRENPVKAPLKARAKVALGLLQEACGSTIPDYFSRPRVVFAALVHATGWRDCEHVLAVLHTFRQQAVQANLHHA